MKKIITLVMLLASLNSFAFGPGPSDSDSNTLDKKSSLLIENLDILLNQAEYSSSTEGRKILEMSRVMINNGDIVLGSCWDYIDAIFNRAGYPQRNRNTIFKSKLLGPYLDNIDVLAPGDWLYFINHSFGDSEHSGIFVAWTNYAKKEALMVSYSGGDQAIPARYKTYDLSSVYNIMRPR
jgi:hypothetical protein